MPYYQLITRKLGIPFTYQSETQIKPGSLANINFNKRQTTGIIIDQVSKPEHDTKPVDELILETGLTQIHLDLCKWIAKHYYCGLHQTLKLFLPEVVWKGKQPKYEQITKLTVPLEKALEQCKRSKKQQELLRIISRPLPDKEGVDPLRGSGGGLKPLLKKNIITISQGPLLSPIKPTPFSLPTTHSLTPDQQTVLDQINTSKHNKFLLHGITGSGKTEIYLRIIQETINKTTTTIKKFSPDKGRCPVSPDRGVGEDGPTSIAPREIGRDTSAQAMLLVPEIALTTQLIHYFQDHFPNQISVLHSKLSQGERLQEWHRIRSGDTKLILGSRSALFTPWINLRLIILDEEHEWTYKQDSTPRYHTREVAEKIIDTLLTTNYSLATKPKLILGSATPSIETYHSAFNTQHSTFIQNSKFKIQNSYQLLSLPTRATNSPLPPVKILDLRQELERRNFTCIAEELQTAIQKRLQKQEQVVLFLNKRGFASSLLCRSCGHAPTCNNCSVSLTLHHIKPTTVQAPIQNTYNAHIGHSPTFKGGLGGVRRAYLICHYCGEAKTPNITCTGCGSAQIKEVGTGTAKAEQQLQQLFPTARILRADKDTTGTKDGFKQIYNKMKNDEADILIGTQMIAKGLDLPRVTLVGVLLADIGLHIPDFRANERVFQLLTQVAGRAGRHTPGEVYIQTYQPEHTSIQFAKNHNYIGFYNKEIKLRETYNYPPFSNIIRLTYKHPDREKAKIEAKKLLDQISLIKEKLLTTNYKLPTISLTPHLFPKLHNKYIWHIYIKGENPHQLIDQIKTPKGWIIDRNPL